MKPFRAGIFEPAHEDPQSEDEDEFPALNVPEDEDEEASIDRLIRCRKIKERNRIITQYLVLWVDKPVEEATWRNAQDFTPEKLRELLEESPPSKDPTSL